MVKIPQSSGIKTKSIVYTIIPVIASFIIICSIMFVALNRSQRNRVAAEFRNIAGKYTSIFENRINSSIDYLSFIADILEFQVREGLTDRETLQKLLFDIFKSHHSINGSSIYFEPDMYDGRDAEYTGTQYGTGHSGRISFYYRRIDGETSYLPQAFDNEIEFSQPYYVDAKQLNAPVYTGPSVFELDGEDVFMLVITYPVRNSRNEFIGAVTADIHLGDIYAQLQAEEIYDTGFILITNEKNQLIYSPVFENIGMYFNETGWHNNAQLTTGNVEFIHARSILNNKKSLVAVSVTHIAQLRSNFFISVAAPLSEINAEGTRLLFIVITLSMIILTLIALFLLFLIDNMTKPLEEFTEIADRIAKGDYSFRINGSYKDEFAVLKSTVNVMAERIDSHMDESAKTLKILQHILSGIDAYVYVSVPITGELLFINDKMKKAFNINNDAIGQHCYKVLQEGIDEICDFCPCYKLEENPDQPIVWEEYNTKTKRFYHNTDCYIEWLGGVKVHLQHSVDVTDLKKITEDKIKAESEARELIQKKEQAEETSRMKSVFLASMSHEIRTPMHGIIGFSELALDDNISAKTRNYLSKINTSAESLLMIINDILDVSKIEAGKMVLEKIPFDASNVFKLCRMIASPKAREKGLTLFSYAEPSIGRMLLGDPTRLRQVLLNLLSNAIKFTNNGIVKLLSAITEKTENTITMRFEVKDSGIGMTEDQIKRIFQPFMQADDSTTRKYGGTGLGLTITKSFIEMMGGILEVESSYGLGSRFSFCITFDTIDVKTANTHVKTAIQIDEKPVFDGEILVCEDNVLNQMVISDHLSKVGLKAVIAGNGRIGLDLIRNRIKNNEKAFDLIFMDIHMPEMDGLEASKILLDMGNKIPVIALTANIMSNDRETYFEAGMCECLSKPFVAHDLWVCLLKYLKPVSTIAINRETYNVEEEDQRAELISVFVKNNQTTVSDINNAIEAGDFILGHRLAHTLKGVAGIIGVPDLADAAQNVEQSLSTGKTESLTEQMHILNKILNKTLVELTPFIQDYADKTRNKSLNEPFDRKRALKLLDTLDLLLASDSFDSLNLVNDLRMIPESEQLADHVENMKFKEARELLADFRKRMENES